TRNPPHQASRIHRFAFNSRREFDHARSKPTSGQQITPLPDENIAAVASAMASTSFGHVRSCEVTVISSATSHATGMTLAKPNPHSQFSHCIGLKISRLEMNHRRIVRPFNPNVRRISTKISSEVAQTTSHS